MGLMLVPTIGQQRQHRRRRPLLTEYCLTCHSDKAKTGGLTLEQLDIDHPETNAGDLGEGRPEASRRD